MRVDQADPRGGEPVVFDEVQDLAFAGGGCLRKRLKQRQKLRSVGQPAAREFPDDQRMACDPRFAQERPQSSIPCTKERDPDWRIDQDHGYGLSGHRRGTGNRLVSVPSSSASRLLLSRAIRDSRPSLTRAVFCLIPVNVDARFNRASSIFSVVRICYNMHKICI